MNHMQSNTDSNDREVGVQVPLAADSRIAIMGQLLFAPWA